MELFLLYIWLKLENLIVVSALLSLGFGVSYLSMIWERDMESKGERLARLQAGRWKRKILVMLSAFCITLAVALPDKSQAVILAGAWLTKELVASPEGQKTLAVIRKKINIELDKALQ